MAALLPSTSIIFLFYFIILFYSQIHNDRPKLRKKRLSRSVEFEIQTAYDWGGERTTSGDIGIYRTRPKHSSADTFC